MEIPILQVDATGFIALIASAFEQLAYPGLMDKLQYCSRVLLHHSDTFGEGFYSGFDDLNLTCYS